MDNTTPNRPTSTINALLYLQKIVLDTLDFKSVVQNIVNGLFQELGYLEKGYRIVVLTLIDEKRGVLKRVALSQTEEAKKATEVSAVPFSQIDIPLTAKDNLLVKAIDTKQTYTTHSWPEIFTPVLTPEQAVKNQQASGIKTSLIYPIVIKDKALGALIFSMIKEESEVSVEERELIQAFTEIVGIAIQNSQLYSSIEEANIQLEIANKLKTDLLTMASHEFRTPISILKNDLYLLNKFFEKEEVKKLVDEKDLTHMTQIKDTVDRLNSVVKNINQALVITSGEITLTPEPIQIESIIQEAIADRKSEADDKKVALVFTPSIDLLPQTMGDKTTLKYVFWELITNALKYSNPEGKIKFTTIKVDSVLEIQVADSGKGIPAESLSKIFGEFGKLDPMHTTQSGMGLGLFVVKKIVTMHEGTIIVSSKEGVGTTITITLPIKPIRLNT